MIHSCCLSKRLCVNVDLFPITVFSEFLNSGFPKFLPGPSVHETNVYSFIIAFSVVLYFSFRLFIRAVTIKTYPGFSPIVLLDPGAILPGFLPTARELLFHLVQLWRSLSDVSDSFRVLVALR